MLHFQSIAGKDTSILLKKVEELCTAESPHIFFVSVKGISTLYIMYARKLNVSLNINLVKLMML